jgi:(1->4)-alpha-D-glucan 1-alpha-D-glucosylmutase
MNVTKHRIPRSTYRLQFNRHFRFTDAAEITGYLKAIGISDIYASPYFTASRGSVHGYDVLDQNSLNPEIGSEEEFDVLTDRLDQCAMGQILDIVPNHMCIEGQGNALWMDVLENGPSAHYAGFFDINWHPLKKELDNKILIPILGDQYGTVLEKGELTLVFEEGSFFIHYYEHTLPIIPKTYSTILTLHIEAIESTLGDANPQIQELTSIVTALGHLPDTTELNPVLVSERYLEKIVVKRRLQSLYQTSSEIQKFIDDNVTTFNGKVGDPGSFDLLEALLLEQVYRVAHWRVATEEINYRRFFDINSLGAIRVEDPVVFEETHRLVLSLVAEGKVNGLRVDHADGLLEPEEYFKRLLSACETRDPSGTAFYLIGEKILINAEQLPDSWPLFGTTGYDFAIQVNGLFVDTSNARLFDTLYTHFVQHRIDFQEVALTKKKLVMQVAMSSEINMLGYYLNRLSEQSRHTRDFTLNSLTKSIVNVIAHFPIYRTYINSFTVTERDRQYIEAAVIQAKRHNPAISASVFDFIHDVLLLHFPATMSDEHKQSWLDFVKRFQQITGPIMAKGVEDSAFYVYNRLVSLNEVGGNPDRFGISLEAFHRQNMERCKNRPLAMLATSTHDTKRSEDVRARINVLSEIPDQWRKSISRWNRQNRKFLKMVDDKPVPDRNEEYLLYQTLVGTWPLCSPGDNEFALFRTRIIEYMVKAMREAKVNTSWINPNIAHEDAVSKFINSVLTVSKHNIFFPDFEKFQQLTASSGMFNSLSQTLLKITSPGIPDIYQGNELWDFSLVDPDNRRTVDFSLRKKLLDGLLHAEATTGPLATAEEVVATRSDGRIKLYLTYKVLGFRREHRALFESGNYHPLAVEGSLANHVCAFERSLDDSSVLVVVPRFCRSLSDDGSCLPIGHSAWLDTRIFLSPETVAGCYRNILTGEVVHPEGQEGKLNLSLSDLLSVFPVALLERVDCAE